MSENFFVIDKVGTSTPVDRPRKMHLQDLDHTASDWDNDCSYWWGRVLTGVDAHWCHDWDGLPIDAGCKEYECCNCGGAD